MKKKSYQVVEPFNLFRKKKELKFDKKNKKFLIIREKEVLYLDYETKTILYSSVLEIKEYSFLS